MTGKYFPPTAAEIHSTGLGFLDGIEYGKQKYDRLERARTEIDDIDHEPHYYIAGYTVANRGKWYLTGVISSPWLTSML